MPILRELVLAIPMLILCLLVSAAVFGPDEHALPSVAVSDTWIGADSLPAARWLAKESFASGELRPAAEPALRERRRDIAPQARIRSVFARFVPGESGRAI